MSKRKITGDCKLRGETGVPLVGSHIIPRSFFHSLKSQNGSKSTVIVEGSKQAEYSQSGVYEYFLCDGCEGVFRPWDSHAKQILLEPWNAADFIEPSVYNLKKADYSNLKLFFLSVLWRAHFSRHRMFSKVNLGPHEAALKDLILKNDPGPTEKYSVIIEKFINVPKHGMTLFEPVTGRFEGRNCYVIFLANYKVHVVTDKRPFPVEKRKLLLSPGMAPVFEIDYQNSAERKAWIEVMNADLKRRSGTRGKSQD